MKVAIIGKRNISDPEAVYSIINETIPRNCSEVVSGGADGVDLLAERYAKEHRLYLKVFLPEYEKYGNVAPLLRNYDIVDYADMIYAFWDMDSKGTRDVIRRCLDTGKPVKIIRLP